MTTNADTVRGTSGRRLGPVARTTRQALLDAVGVVLETTPWHLVTVTDVARAANTSAASFYQYFPALADAALELAGCFERRAEPMPQHLQLVAELLRFEQSGLRRP